MKPTDCQTMLHKYDMSLTSRASWLGDIEDRIFECEEGEWSMRDRMDTIDGLMSEFNNTYEYMIGAGSVPPEKFRLDQEFRAMHRRFLIVMVPRFKSIRCRLRLVQEHARAMFDKEPDMIVRAQSLPQ